jgi:hypothetical protein
MLGTELFVTSAMASVVGRGVFDRRTASVVLKSLVACALVVGVDRLTASIGWARLALDAAVYAIVIVATGAVRPSEIAGALRAALRYRRHSASPALAGDNG